MISFPADRKDRHIILYRPNYLLLLYYSVRPDRQICVRHTPDNEVINRKEVKFQISFRIPVVRLFAVDLSVAYTQLSYWQPYQTSSFFRENNYEPAAFLGSDKRLRLGNWDFRITGIGAAHQPAARGTADLPPPVTGGCLRPRAGLYCGAFSISATVRPLSTRRLSALPLNRILVINSDRDFR